MSAQIKKWQDRVAESGRVTAGMLMQMSLNQNFMQAEITDLRAELARRDAVASEGQAMRDQLWNALSLMLDTFERPLGMYANERKVCDLARTALSRPTAIREAEQSKPEQAPHYIPGHWQEQAHQLINELGSRTVSADTAVKAQLFLRLLLTNGPRADQVKDQS